MKAQKMVGAAVLCALLLLNLSGCKNKGPVAPEAYTFGEDSTPSIDTVLTKESGGEFVSMVLLDQDGNEVALEGEGEKDKEKEKDTEADPAAAQMTAVDTEAAATEPDRYVYTYEKLKASGDAVQTYVELLTGPDNSFTVVDEEGAETELPSYKTEAGEVLLSKASATEGFTFMVKAQWTKETVTVSVLRPANAAEAAEFEAMTMGDASTFLTKFTPADLGLSGDSMNTYSMYPSEGIVMVDGQGCVRVQVFRKEANGENLAQGTYLITGDKTKVYRLDEENGVVTPVNDF